MDYHCWGCTREVKRAKGSLFYDQYRSNLLNDSVQQYSVDERSHNEETIL